MAFRTKSVIKTALRDALNSNLWNQIKDSLIGSELIAYASEFLYQDERISDNLVSGMYPSENAPLQQLAQTASYANVVFSKYTPATITIKLKNTDNNTVYEPFSLCLNKGSVSYWNIDYVSSKDIITLYQGKLCCSATNSSISGKFNATTTVKMSINRDYSNTMNYSFYSTLSYSAYPESVKCFGYTSLGKWEIYDIYRPMTSSPTTKNYKLKWNSDMYLDLYFGNGMWGEPYNSDNEYFVYYLEGSRSAIELSNLKLSYGSDNLEYSVVSYKEYDESNASAFASLNANMNKNAVLGTKNEIEAFANTFPYVSCSIAKKTGVNEVTVYVQPTDEFIEKHADNSGNIDANILNDLVENLQAYGEIVVDYKAMLATEVDIQVKVMILDYVGDGVFASIKSQIQDYVNTRFNNLSLGESIDFSTLSSDIFTEFKVRCVVSLNVKNEEIGDDSMLTYQPNVYSIELANSSDKFHIDFANIFSKIGNAYNFGASSFAIGDYVVLGKVNKHSYICNVNNKEILGKDADLLIIEDNDYAMKFNRVFYGDMLSMFGVRFSEMSENLIYEFSSFVFTDRLVPPTIDCDNDSNIFSTNSLGLSFSRSENPSVGKDDWNPYIGKSTIAYDNGSTFVPRFLPRTMYYDGYLYVFNDGVVKRYSTKSLYLKEDSEYNQSFDKLSIDNDNYLGMFVSGDDLIVLGENNGYSYYIHDFQSANKLDATNSSITGVNELSAISLDYFGGLRTNDDICLLPYFNNSNSPFVNYACHGLEANNGNSEITIYKSPNSKYVHLDLHVKGVSHTSKYYINSDNKHILKQNVYMASTSGRYLHLKIDTATVVNKKFTIWLQAPKTETSDDGLSYTSYDDLYTLNVNIADCAKAKYSYILCEKPTYDATTRNISINKIQELDFSNYLSNDDGFSASYITPIRYEKDENNNKLYLLQINPTSECDSCVICAEWNNSDKKVKMYSIDNKTTDGMNFMEMQQVGYFKKNGELVMSDENIKKEFVKEKVNYQASSTYFAVNQESYLRLYENGVEVEKIS